MGNTGTGGAPNGLPFCGKWPWGSRGIWVELLMNFWGGLRICYVCIWDWETTCAKDFLGTLLVFRGRKGIMEEFGGRSEGKCGRAAGLIGRAGDF